MTHDQPKAVSRRAALGLLSLLPPALWLAACGDSDNKTAEKAPPAPAQPTETTPAPKTSDTLPESSGTVDMAKLLQPGQLPDMVMGKADAPVTIVEYASMTCPHCAHFSKTTLPMLKTKYIDTGKARLILREFPFDPRAEAGFMLARCSQDKYFPMVDVLFSQQQNWAAAPDARSALLQIAKLAGFSQASFEACLTDQKLLDQIRSVRERGTTEFGVNATPTFFVNGKKYSGALSPEEMSAVIDGFLNA